MREEYLGPVGFAKEPAEERKRWILRIITIAFVIFIVWLAVTRVLRAPTDNPTPGRLTNQSTLPAPE